MTYPMLTEIVDLGLLDEMVSGGLIRCFEHNNGDLVGYDYTQRAQWDRVWNEATLNCRGLIVDTAGRVIARPFPKFFNLGERPEVDERYVGKPFRLFEKVDGSLGIRYEWGGQSHVATRGSFHSDQATWASERVKRMSLPMPGATELFEIVYPENRIVVDYGDEERLVHLAWVDMVTARRSGIPGNERQHQAAVYHASVQSAGSVHSQFEHLDDGNFEGFVAEYEDGHRVKIKLSEYVRLHRIMSFLSNRTIWEALSNGTSLERLIEGTPDEFYDWARGEAEAFLYAHSAMVDCAHRAVESIHGQIGGDAPRSAFAAEAKLMPHTGLIFAALDGKDVAGGAWRALRPETIEYPPVGPGTSHGDTCAVVVR